MKKILLVGVFVSAAFACNEARPPHGVVQQESPAAFCPDEMDCGKNPATVELECEMRYGSSSGKDYSIFSGCSPDDTDTNSDCFSNCIINNCYCGLADGREGACIGQGMLDPNEDWTCRCHRTTNQLHNYWCCEGTPENHTVDAWSCGDYCGAGGDITEPVNEGCAEAPDEESTTSSTGTSSGGSSGTSSGGSSGTDSGGASSSGSSSGSSFTAPCCPSVVPEAE